MEGGVDFCEVNPLSSSGIVVVTLDFESSPPLSSPAAPTLLLSLSPSSLLLSLLVAKHLRLSKLESFDLPHLGTRAREKKQEVPLKRVSLWHWILSLKARRNSEFRGMKLQLVRVPISERNDGRSSKRRSVSEWHGLCCVWPSFEGLRLNAVMSLEVFLVWMWLLAAFG